MLDRAVLLPAPPDPLVADAVALEGMMIYILVAFIAFTFGFVLCGLLTRRLT